MALLRARANMAKILGDNHDQEAGIKMVLKAIEARCARSLPTPATSRAWWSTRCWKARATSASTPPTGTYGDMIEMGVLIRPGNRTAPQNAASVAR